MSAHPRERLMAYADGELDRHAASEIERHLDGCTECSRELSIVNGLKGAMKEMESNQSRDVWGAVHRRLTTPVGWLLILGGTLFWVVLAVVRWFQAELTVEWLASTAVVTGLVMLLVAVGSEQYRNWKIERYKDVER